MRTMSLVKKTLAVAVLVGFVFPLVGHAGPMSDPTCSPRPLSDFLDAQGSGSNFFPPVPDYVGWADRADPDPTTFALVDYAGLADQYILAETGSSLGTAVEGRVLECERADGKTAISVVLSTRNALGFAQSFAALAASGFDFLNTPTIFGNKAQDVVVNGADAAVGPATLRTTFTNPDGPDAPLPDLIDVVFNPSNYDPVTVDFRSTTVGTLPDGSPARLDVQQVGGPEIDDEGNLVFTREIVDVVGLE